MHHKMHLPTKEEVTLWYLFSIVIILLIIVIVTMFFHTLLRAPWRILLIVIVTIVPTLLSQNSVPSTPVTPTGNSENGMAIYLIEGEEFYRLGSADGWDITYDFLAPLMRYPKSGVVLHPHDPNGLLYILDCHHPYGHLYDYYLPKSYLDAYMPLFNREKIERVLVDFPLTFEITEKEQLDYLCNLLLDEERKTHDYKPLHSVRSISMTLKRTDIPYLEYSVIIRTNKTHSDWYLSINASTGQPVYIPLELSEVEKILGKENLVSILFIWENEDS